MKSTPSQLGARYLPFLVVGAILCLLIVLTPSVGRQPAVTTGDFTGERSGSGFSGELAGGDAGVDASGAPLSGGAATGRVSAGGVAARGSSPGGAGSAGAGTGGGAGVTGDMSNCDANGFQKAPYSTGVRCRAKWAGGDNGGATMGGISGAEIRYVWFNPPSNAVIDGILAGAGYARETGPFCDTMVAYENSAQKRFEMSGRKLVSLDGPGNNAGSSGCNGKYKFWQSTCPSDRVDEACYRAEAKTIATQLKPAFVLNPRGVPALHEAFASYGIVDIGYGGSRERFQQYAPYLWGTGFGSERIVGLHSEYYCKRLVGKAPAYAGDDVKSVWKIRRVGLIYPDLGDGSLKPVVEQWLRTVKGCGDPNAKLYPYQADVTQAQQQAQNVAAQMRTDQITTVGFCCDPVSMVFFLQALENNNYRPEHLILPVSSIASDVVGQLTAVFGVQEQWKHAFGISNYPVNQPDAGLDFRKAYADGGGPGGTAGAKSIEIESWGVFVMMMQMIHAGGPRITPRSIFDAMQDLPPVPPTKRTTGADFAPPDPFTPLRDVAEIWWNPNLRSYYNDSQGAMCYVNEAARYDIGQIPRGDPRLFTTNADCARLEEYEKG